MHDTDGMTAIHSAPRLSDHKFQSYEPMYLKTNYEPYVKDNDTYSEELDNDDDFSDHDSHYSEDLPDNLDGLDPRRIVENVPDFTQQLLDFSEMVNADIKKFFGRNRNEDDACDIYEDKWKPTKSGRELYYADLLRVAQGDNDVSRSKVEAKSPIPVPDLDNRHTFSGKLDEKKGLGPFSELFDYGMRPSIIEKDTKFKRLKRARLDERKQTDVVPMHDRNLPSSFWREPSNKETESRSELPPPVGILSSSKPPDFSDLLQSWTGGHADFPEDMATDGNMETTAPTAIQSL